MELSDYLMGLSTGFCIAGWVFIGYRNAVPAAVFLGLTLLTIFWSWVKAQNE